MHHSRSSDFHCRTSAKRSGRVEEAPATGSGTCETRRRSLGGGSRRAQQCRISFLSAPAQGQLITLRCLLWAINVLVIHGRTWFCGIFWLLEILDLKRDPCGQRRGSLLDAAQVSSASVARASSGGCSPCGRGPWGGPVRTKHASVVSGVWGCFHDAVQLI